VNDDWLIEVGDRRPRERRASSRTTSKSCAPIGVRRRAVASDRRLLCERVRDHAAECDAVILSDYAKGLIARDVVEAALACPLVLADPKPQIWTVFPA